MSLPRIIRTLPALALCAIAAFAANPAVPGCGTHIARAQEERYLHQRAAARTSKARAAAIATNRDYGDIAVIEDSEGVVARRNPFNLNARTVTFTPSAPAADRYRLATAADSYDPVFGEIGEKVNLDDDDSIELTIPFAFPFFGNRYRSVNLNSDGNLTFGGPFTLTERSLGMLVGGRPRIAALFTDLDPSAARGAGGVYVSREPWRFVITWRSVPLYTDFGLGVPQTFQIRLYADGAIELAYSAISVSSEAVAGISPGGGKGTLSLISFAAGSPDEFSGPVADRFSGIDSVDVAAAAQRFYATHEDAYDYLVFFNALGVPAGESAVAFEVTVRNHRTGYGDTILEAGEDFGSGKRLQAVMNMGPLSQYPDDPNNVVPARGPTGDTGLTVLAHEAGHLFLAFASVRDPSDPNLRPMLGRALAHWAFTFNSEASVLEGNRIQDSGEGSNPRFRTIATVEGYSPLDQYLMGFRSPDEVPPTFLVERASVSPSRAPQAGVSMNGQRRNILVDEIIAAEGRRTPDHTVAQRRFRFGFVLIAAAGATVSPEQIAKVEAYRAAFEQYFSKASSNRAAATATLRKAVQLSFFPAAGVLLNGTGAATASLDAPAATPLTLLLNAREGAVSVPASVEIPAGARSVTFSIRGVRDGVDEVTATPSDSAYETAAGRIQVANSTQAVSLSLVSPERVQGDPGLIVARVTDINALPYSGVLVNAAPSNGVLAASSVRTGENGEAVFRWTPALPEGTLRLSIDGSANPPVTVTLTARPTVNAVVNAASFVPGMTPGSLGTIFGAGLSGSPAAQAAALLPFALGGVQVLINGVAVPLSYVSDAQINFAVPANLAGETAAVAVLSTAGESAEFTVSVRPVSPGIFVIDAANQGAVLIANTGQTTFQRPAQGGDFIEIYATGLSASKPEVQIGNLSAEVLVSTPLARYPGLYQINAVVPPGLPPGDRPLVLISGGVRSNEVLIRLR